MTHSNTGASHLLLVSCVLLVIAGCATLRGETESHPAVGAWQYVVEDTPQGDAEGTLTIEQSDGTLTGQMSSAVMGQTVPITVLTAETSQFRFQATFQNQGEQMEVVTDATIQSDPTSMRGTMQVEGYGEFTFRAQPATTSN